MMSSAFFRLQSGLSMSKGFNEVLWYVLGIRHSASSDSKSRLSALGEDWYSIHCQIDLFDIEIEHPGMTYHELLFHS